MLNRWAVKSRTQRFEIIGVGVGACIAMLLPVVGDWPVKLIVLLFCAMIGWAGGLVSALIFRRR